MPRNGSGVMSWPSGTTVVTNTTIESAPYNTFLADLLSDLNAARPITAGGTGATSASAARIALGLEIGTDVQAFGALLDDLNTLGANAADSEFLVGTGAGALAWESGATLRTSIGVGTGDTPQLTGVEVGHATDTTLARASAGVVSIEGNHIPSPASQAEGDVLYHNGTTWARLAKGTALQLLRMNSGATAPEWVSGTIWTLLGEGNPSAAASYDLPSIGSYREIWIEISNLLPASANQELLLRTDSGAADVGDSGASDYYYNHLQAHAGGGTHQDSAAANGIYLTSQNASRQISTTAPGLSGDIYIKNFNQTANAVVTGTLCYREEGTAELGTSIISGYRADTTARDFVQIIATSGNITGNIKVWGK